VVLLAYGSLGDHVRATTDAEEAETILRVNLNSPVCWLTLLAERLRAQIDATKGNRAGVTLAAIGSVAGDRGRKGNYIYGSAKGGLDRFLQGLRNRHHGSGLRVVTIKPGFVDTPMTAEFKKGPLFASADRVGESIFRSLEQPSWYTTLSGDVLYVPWFWRGIMCVIQHIPEVIFRRLSI
jgi:NAD(P)-dependent dehydrogenase (short-subunit alcohol dehydrogenase family)